LDEFQLKRRIGQGAMIHAETTYLPKWSGQTTAFTEMGLEGWKTEVREEEICTTAGGNASSADGETTTSNI
jgi:hypothetical protein